MSFADEFEDAAQEEPVYDDAGHEARVRLSLEIRSLRAGGGEELSTEILREIVENADRWILDMWAVEQAKKILASREGES